MFVFCQGSQKNKPTKYLGRNTFYGQDKTIFTANFEILISSDLGGPHLDNFFGTLQNELKVVDWDFDGKTAARNCDLRRVWMREQIKAGNGFGKNLTNSILSQDSKWWEIQLTTTGKL